MWSNFYITWQNHIISTKVKGLAKSGYKQKRTCKSFYMFGDITMKSKIYESGNLDLYLWKIKIPPFYKISSFSNIWFLILIFFFGETYNWLLKGTTLIYFSFIYLFFTTSIPTGHEKKGRGLGFRVLGDWSFPLTPPHSICVSVSARTSSFLLHRPVPPCPPPGTYRCFQRDSLFDWHVKEFPSSSVLFVSLLHCTQLPA